jgi:hypothetical protein
VHLSKVFTPNDNHLDQDIEEDITTLLQNILPIKIFSPKVIKEEIQEWRLLGRYTMWLL